MGKLYAAVTGASGFLGSALCHELLARGHRVRAFSRSIPIGLGDHHVLLPEQAGGDWWTENLADIHVVFHCAGLAHVMGPKDMAVLDTYRQANVELTGTVATAALRAGVGRFVFVSSSKVWGESSPSGRALNEATPPAPCEPYAISKWEAEQELAQLLRDGPCHYTIMRPPLIYGPNPKANLKHLVKLADTPWPLPFASLDAPRSFIFLANLTDALIHIVDQAGAYGQTFGVTDGEDMSVATLVAKIRSAMTRPIRLFPVPSSLLRLGAAAIGKPHLVDSLALPFVIDTAKIRQNTGWLPSFTPEEAIPKILAPSM